MRRTLCIFALGLALLHPMTAAQADPAIDGFVATGSFSMESTFLLWVDALNESTKNKEQRIRVSMRPMTATQGIKEFTEGKAQLAPVTREFKADEVKAFTTKWGYAPTRIAVAMDALVILVHKSNPIKEIKIEQLDAVWSSTRLQGWPSDIKTWGELGLTNANWNARPIVRVGRPEGSGIRDFFREAVELGGKGKTDTKHSEDAMGLMEEILSNQAAMGYGSLGEVVSNLRAIPLIPKGGKAAVEPTTTSVTDGSYPLSRVIYIYLNRAPGKPLDPHLVKFMRFVLSKDGQKQVKLNGLVPLPDDLIAMNLRRVGQ